MTDSEKNNDLSSSDGLSSDSDVVNPDYFHKKNKIKKPEKYIEGILSGDKMILSRAITLIENTKPEYRDTGQEILEKCLPHSGNSIRVGITGVPGVGKSTFIEALGNLVIEEGRRLAVLTVDPSSSKSKGSILGDKTRMQTLSNSEQAYIRPSPASGTLGGVTQKTREVILLCEAAGFDTIFVETVGVGQSETVVHSMIDFFLLLMLAGAGDELQGIKRGIMEMADMIAINKAEESNMAAANRAKTLYKNALALFPDSESGWKPPVLTCSALEGTGIDEIWENILSYIDLVKENGFFEQRRAEQAAWWLHQTIERQLKDRFYRNPEVKQMINLFEQDVMKGTITPFKAANELLALFEKNKK
ncbi:MAG: methylmalonyl Co-A mutase-associated GTPase MeaB [Balneolaceae bacterium]